MRTSRLTMTFAPAISARPARGTSSASRSGTPQRARIRHTTPLFLQPATASGALEHEAQRAGDAAAHPEAATAVSPATFPVRSDRNRLRQIPSAGEPLTPSVRDRMERSLGGDFGDVRIHTGSGAERLVRSLGANALTSG